MKINKIQKEMFNALCGDSMCKIMIKMSDSETCFSIDGYKAFVLPNAIVNFNTNRFTAKNELKNDLFEPNAADRLMTISNDLRLTNGGRKMIRKLVCQEGETIDGAGDKPTSEMWVDNKFLDYFENPKLYAHSKVSRILVVEPLISKSPCAVLLPVRS